MMCLVERLAKIEDYYSDLGFTNDRVEAFRAEVRSALGQHDRLWQWESSGFRHFRGVTGVLIERAGEVVRVWITGRS
jgi:hypothetical protein